MTALRKFVKINDGRNSLSTRLDKVVVNYLFMTFLWVKRAPLPAMTRTPNVAETTARIIFIKIINKI